jgi:hypothetical protein
MGHSFRRRVVVCVAVLTCVFAIQTTAGVAANSVTFYFKRTTNLQSQLTIQLSNADTGQIYQRVSYRAGSGDSTNECASSHGWLPGGLYSIIQHSDSYDASKIKGRVWQLSDHVCSGGAQTLRTELFIHSEETASRGQACGPAGTDYPFCWEGNNDYYSEGCIKLDHWGGMPTIDNQWHSWSGVAGPNKLLVQ